MTRYFAMICAALVLVIAVQTWRLDTAQEALQAAREAVAVAQDRQETCRTTLAEAQAETAKARGAAAEALAAAEKVRAKVITRVLRVAADAPPPQATCEQSAAWLLDSMKATAEVAK